jgi:sulfiredoxin
MSSDRGLGLKRADLDAPEPASTAVRMRACTCGGVPCVKGAIVRTNALNMIFSWEFVAISPVDIQGEESPSSAETQMLKRQTFAIADIYVPVKRRMTLNPATVRKIAESILEVGLQSPILVRQDGTRLVLVEGLHRLEACKELGEQTIVAFLVQARRH